MSLLTTFSYTNYDYSHYTALGEPEQDGHGNKSYSHVTTYGGTDIISFENAGEIWRSNYDVTGNESQTCDEHMEDVWLWHYHDVVISRTITYSGDSGSAICLIKDPRYAFWVGVYAKGVLSGSIQIYQVYTWDHWCEGMWGGDIHEVWTTNDLVDTRTVSDAKIYMNINGTIIQEYESSMEAGEAINITPCMCKIGEEENDFAVIWGVYKEADLTMQYFLYYKEILRSSEIFNCEADPPGSTLHNMKDIAGKLIPDDAETIYGCGWARMGFIHSTGIKEK